MDFCEPKFATQRNPERDTFGPRIAKIAERLGTPLMGWQRLVADVGGEWYLDDETGIVLPAYREVVVTIPRQNGKTTLVLSWEMDRCLTWGRRQRVAYTAQTGLDARKKLLEDQLPMIESSILKAAVRNVRRAKGEEGVDFQGGSAIDVLASTESAGHGRTLHLGVIDEAFKDEDDRREGAMLPAMTTVADAQILVVSTMGTDKSVYLNRKVTLGRDTVSARSKHAEIAYFEWAADRSEDIDDPATWRGCMPAFGVTVTERTIRHARETMTEGEFRRAYLNQRTAADEQVIPAEDWEAVQDPDAVPGGEGTPNPGDLVFAIDCNPERTHSSLVVADKHGCGEVIQQGEGTAWLVDLAAKKAKRWNMEVAYDPTGPAGVFGDALEYEGLRTRAVAGRDMDHACSFFFDGCIDHKLRIRPNEALSAAIGAARQRVSGDSWRWGRRDTDSDLSPLVAMSIAVWSAANGIDPVANVH